MNRVLPVALLLFLLLPCVGCAAQAVSDHASDEVLLVQQAQGGAQTPASNVDTGAVVESEEPPPAPPAEEEPYVRVIDPSAPMVALTFDDGPHKTYSHAILDILEEHHSVATFFEVARNIPRCPDALVRMLEMGCEVGSHSNVHQDLSGLTYDEMLLDLQRADEKFIAATGVAPTLLRPPYGAVNWSIKYASGRSVVTWNIDTLDWQSRDAQTLIDYVQSLQKLDGQVILMHSIYQSTVDAVAVLVPWLIEQGYQLVTVTELMAYYYGELPQPNQYYDYTYFITHRRTDTPLELPVESETSS